MSDINTDTPVNDPADLPAVLSTIPPPPIVEKYQPAAEPIPLCVLGTVEILAWACGSCRVIHGGESGARSCCACSRCGKLTGRGRGMAHPECKALDDQERDAEWRLKERVREARALLKASPIPAAEYDDPVMRGDEDVEMDVGEMEGECIGDSEDLRPFVYGTTKHTLCISAESALENALEQDYMHESAGDDVSQEARDDLDKRISGWNELYGSTVASYAEDRSIAVVLDRPAYDRAIEAAKDTIALVTIVKALCAALFMLNVSPAMQEWAWQRKPWIHTLAKEAGESS